MINSKVFCVIPCRYFKIAGALFISPLSEWGLKRDQKLKYFTWTSIFQASHVRGTIIFNVRMDCVSTNNSFAMVTITAWTTPMRRTASAFQINFLVRLGNALLQTCYVTSKRAAVTGQTRPDVVSKSLYYKVLGIGMSVLVLNTVSFYRSKLSRR